MKFEQLIENYVDLLLSVGIKVSDGDRININITTELDWLAVKLSKRSYELGASEVLVSFGNPQLERQMYDFQTEEELKNIYQHQIERDKMLVEKQFKSISISSPNPYIMEGVDSSKVQTKMGAIMDKCNLFRKNASSNNNTWCVAAAANQAWADYATEGDIDKLWSMIFQAMRVDQPNYAELWDKHIENLSTYATKLTEYQVDTLHFSSELGTDLHVGLVKDHIWCAACEANNRTGQKFIPNMPTEEVFTMPDKYRVDGIVYASKPLNHNGQIIDQFWIKFEDGKAVDFDAERGRDTLAELIASDSGSSRLGEVALVSKQSPINQMNQLFYNTLFDENSSCHLAFGNAYPTNIVGGVEMSDEQLEANHVNTSKEHVDFMFGTEQMTVTGYIGKEKIAIFENGDFVI